MYVHTHTYICLHVCINIYSRGLFLRFWNPQVGIDRRQHRELSKKIPPLVFWPPSASALDCCALCSVLSLCCKCECM